MKDDLLVRVAIFATIVVAYSSFSIDVCQGFIIPSKKCGTTVLQGKMSWSGSNNYLEELSPTTTTTMADHYEIRQQRQQQQQQHQGQRTRTPTHLSRIFKS